MKKIFSIILSLVIITAISLCNLEQVNADNSDVNLEYKNNLNHQHIIENYVSSIDKGNWEKWLDCYSPSVKSIYTAFIEDENNYDKGLGVFGITSAKIGSIKKIDNAFAPKVYELAEYQENSTNYETYLIDLELTVKKDTDYFHNGENYKLIVLVNDSGQWNVGIFCGIPDNYQKLLVQEKIIHKQKFDDSNPISPLGISYGLLNPGTIPTNITVVDNTGNYYNVSFSYFVKNVTQNEIGNLNFNSDAIKAQAMAAKITGWWCKVAHYRDAIQADIRFGDVTFIYGVPINSKVVSACDYISNYHMFSSSGKLFYAAYYNGSYGWGGQSSGKLRQNGANFLANKQGYSWRNILHYYYDNSSYNNPNVGTVQIN